MLSSGIGLETRQMDTLALTRKEWLFNLLGLLVLLGLGLV
jgi:hypothetical protein